MNNNTPFEITSTRIVYENPWIKIREDQITRSNGTAGLYGYLEVDTSVVVVAVKEQKEICLVQSYRHPFGKWFWEFPGGGGDGEDVVLASKRELEEEAGITSGDWMVLGKSRVCNGLSNEWQINVLAKNLSYGDYVQHEEETRDRKFVSLKALDEMIYKGEFEDNQSITALYMYKLWLDRSTDK